MVEAVAMEVLVAFRAEFLVVRQLWGYFDRLGSKIWGEGRQNQVVVVDDRRPYDVGRVNFIFKAWITTFDGCVPSVRRLLYANDVAFDVRIESVSSKMWFVVPLLQQHAVRYRNTLLVQAIGCQPIHVERAVRYFTSFLR